MHAAVRTKLMAMPLVKLKKIQSDVEALVREVEGAPRREVDIAAEHGGAPALTCAVLEKKAARGGNRWRQLETIYCSLTRCPECPHGPYWYEYRTNKRRGTVTVVLKGKMAFDYDLIQRLKRDASPGKAYVIRRVVDDRMK
jgi:hypothetical protein